MFLVHPSIPHFGKLHYFCTEGTQEYICRLLLFLTAKLTNGMRGLGKESQMRNFLDPK